MTHRFNPPGLLALVPRPAVTAPVVQWMCDACGGAEESAPGCEPPSPPVCHTCARLDVSLPAGGRSVAQLLADLADAGPVCTPEDDVLFFEPDYETPRERAYRVRAAKALCRSCPALESCRAYALATHTTHGVWAALTASELRELRTGNQPREVA